MGISSDTPSLAVLSEFCIKRTKNKEIACSVPSNRQI